MKNQGNTRASEREGAMQESHTYEQVYYISSLNRNIPIDKSEILNAMCRSILFQT